MGNCQAAEAATVLIQHPCGNRVERMYWSVSANQVMTSNPGHYVAVIVTSSKTNTNTTTTTAAPPPPPVKYLKLLRPDDTLHLGHVYRLVSFEEVLKEFATKKHVKLSRLLVANKEEEKKNKKKMRRSKRSEGRILDINPAESSPQVVEGLQVDAEAAAAAAAAAAEEEEDQSSGRPSGPVPRPGQWRPALQSIAEIGTYI